jgi:DNA polymerase
MFDRNVLRLGNLKLEVPIERWRDTMVQAYCHALPGALDKLGKVLGLPQEQQKLDEGKALIRRFCKPAPRNHKADRYTADTHPDEWGRFCDYAIQDVAAMRECARRMPTWNWDETTIAEWHLDQHINDRGFAVDMELALAGQNAAIVEKERLTVRFAELTGGLSPGQHKAVLDFINQTWGLGLDSSAKEVILPITKDETLPAELRELCQLKCDANKTSTAKYGAIYEATSSDGRFRGGLQFAGASRTRRWAGRKFQPQNLPSRGLPPAEEIDSYIEALKAGAHDLLFDDLMLYGAAALRGLVTV